MLFADGLLGILVIGLWIFAIFDVITSDADSVRNLPKLIWLLVVIVLVDIGALAWLFLGRPQRVGRPARARPYDGARDTGGAHPSAGRRTARPRPSRGPEDDPDFESRMRNVLGADDR